MTRTLILITVSLIFFLSCQPKKGPILSLNMDTVRVEKVKMGTIQKALIQVYNPGDDTLKLGRLALSCGCTDGQLGSNVLAPGDSTQLSLVYYSDGDADNKSGFINKSVVIENNSKDAFKIVRIIGTIAN